MSYSLSVPSVARNVEFEDLRDRVKDTMDLVGYTEERAAPGVRERILMSVDTAMKCIQTMQLEGESFNMTFSGHVKQGDMDVMGDFFHIGVAGSSQVLS